MTKEENNSIKNIGPDVDKDRSLELKSLCFAYKDTCKGDVFTRENFLDLIRNGTKQIFKLNVVKNEPFSGPIICKGRKKIT